MKEELPILFRDEHLVAVPNHPDCSCIEPSSIVTNAIRRPDPARPDRPARPSVHRLDRGTSGVLLLFALDRDIGRV